MVTCCSVRAVPRVATQFATPPAVAQDHAHHGQSHTGADTHPFIRDMDRDMAKMMAEMHAPGYSGNWDVDFLAMMIPHHQGAIDMARLLLVHGRDPLTRNLAEEIIASQQVEIDAMRARLAVLRDKSPDPAAEDFPPLSGTRGSAR